MINGPRSRPRVPIWAGALATLFVAAAPALAQDPPPPPPPPVAVEPIPPPPPPVQEPAPMAAIAAPRAAHDMTGSVGFGLGVVGSSQIIGTDSAVQIRYWMSDALVLAPSLFFYVDDPNGDDNGTWEVQPELVALFVLAQGSSTRLLGGGGLGLGIGERVANQPDPTIFVRVPVQIGVEHFLARWFSLGLAARSPLFFLESTGDNRNMHFELRTTSLLGSAIIYTD